MRVMIGTALAAGLALMGCTDKQAAREQADARAAGFVPPSVTSRLDYGGAMERRFRALDRDGDEKIGKDELPAKTAPRLQGYDRNKDGFISAIEFSEGSLARFDAMDLNHDGTVTTEERQASRQR
ncbi:hypothetical protein U1701_04550 [Sphingomonas sp. PB2P19]|uniref:hypothetical protein n=1 Tax=Sphingomonas rhamnosi TaxID=3096156 RepID=UPI002FC5DE81